MIPATRDDASAPFFDAAADGTLLARRCGNCGNWVTPALFFGGSVTRCPVCRESALDWAAVSGNARLVTWTVVADMPSILDGTPGQLSGIVELQEGPWMVAGLDVARDELAEGIPLVVGFARPADGEPVPVFRRAG